MGSLGPVDGKLFSQNFLMNVPSDVDLLQVSLAEKKQEKEKQGERLVILSMLINIHEQSSLAPIFKNDGVVVNCFIEA